MQRGAGPTGELRRCETPKWWRWAPREPTSARKLGPDARLASSTSASTRRATLAALSCEGPARPPTPTTGALWPSTAWPAWWPPRPTVVSASKALFRVTRSISMSWFMRRGALRVFRVDRERAGAREVLPPGDARMETMARSSLTKWADDVGPLRSAAGSIPAADANCGPLHLPSRSEAVDRGAQCANRACWDLWEPRGERSPSVTRPHPVLIASRWWCWAPRLDVLRKRRCAPYLCASLSCPRTNGRPRDR